MNILKMAVSFLLVSTQVVHASNYSNARRGIDAIGLPDANGNILSGAGIPIGMIEEGRPGAPTVTPNDNANLSNSFIKPTAVFFRNLAPTQNDTGEISDHATEVAGTIISNEFNDPNMDGDFPVGTARQAMLYASAFGTTSDVNASIAAQHLISVEPDIRAMNMSFALPLTGTHIRDGNQHFTQFVDWSARHHDVLYLAAGNQNTDTDSIPTDNFNGVTVGASESLNQTFPFIYDHVASFMAFDREPEGFERVSVDLLAPGVDIESGSLNDTQFIRDGTSYAAPHVAGTVALLQEYAEERVGAAASGWTETINSKPTAYRHEVMKAVLMNSADKLKDDGSIMINGLPVQPGHLLGMQKTVFKQDAVSTWLDSFAYDDSINGQGQFEPLDVELGAGHLNAARARTQFAAGEQSSGAGDVSILGWDYNSTTGKDDFNKYVFDEELDGGSFISVTLAWDRFVDFDIDTGTQDFYDSGDTFLEHNDPSHFPEADTQINDLDIFLLPKGAFSHSQAIASANSIEGTLEHLFFQIPSTGEYEFWIRQFDEDSIGGITQDYAVAWWGKRCPCANICRL